MSEAHDGFEDFYRLWYPRICTYINASASNAALAQELAQEAMIQALRAWSELRCYDDNHQAGWILRTARHRLIDEMRRQQRVSSSGAEVEPVATGDHQERVASCVDVRAAIRRLPPRQREAVILTELVGLSSQAAAAIMGLSEGTVRYHCSVARKQLAEELDVDDRKEGL